VGFAILGIYTTEDPELFGFPFFYWYADVTAHTAIWARC
jgi:hypothetical protein